MKIELILIACTPNDFKDKLEDTAFINNLQNLVLQWTSDICKVLSLSRDISSGTAIEEVNFWLRLEKVLEDSKLRELKLI